MGEGKLEFQMPSGWSAADVRVSGDESSILPELPVESGDIITSTFYEGFGDSALDSIDIILVDITTPNQYEDQRFTVKAKNEKGRLTSLKMKPSAFVGNAMADDDTVTVEISPTAAYEKETRVDFEIELTATGPMHDGRIQITVPSAFEDIQDDPAEPNYVRVSVSVRGAGLVDIEGVDDEIIIMTGDLDAGETITVRIEDVDIPDDVSDSTSFMVGTKTRGAEADLEECVLL